MLVTLKMRGEKGSCSSMSAGAPAWPRDKMASGGGGTSVALPRAVSAVCPLLQQRTLSALDMFSRKLYLDSCIYIGLCLGFVKPV